MKDIGDYQADRWLVISKTYKEDILVEYDTHMLDTNNYGEMCNQIIEIRNSYIREDDVILSNPRKSVYILRKGNKKIIIKAVKI